MVDRSHRSSIRAAAPQLHQIEWGTAGNHGERCPAGRRHALTVLPGQCTNVPQVIAASQADGSGVVVTCRPSWLALVASADSVVKAGGGAARHTRACSVGAPAVVAGCRRLRFVPQPCQMRRSATVNTGAQPSNSRSLPRQAKPQLSPQITQPLS